MAAVLTFVHNELQMGIVLDSWIVYVDSSSLSAGMLTINSLQLFNYYAATGSGWIVPFFIVIDGSSRNLKDRKWITA
jgi:hypothetical protein